MKRCSRLPPRDTKQKKGKTQQNRNILRSPAILNGLYHRRLYPVSNSPPLEPIDKQCGRPIGARAAQRQGRNKRKQGLEAEEGGGMCARGKGIVGLLPPISFNDTAPTTPRPFPRTPVHSAARAFVQRRAVLPNKSAKIPTTKPVSKGLPTSSCPRPDSSQLC